MRNRYRQTETSQRMISETVKLSLGTVNKILLTLRENAWVHSDLSLTEAAYEALEPYRAKRLIFLAAGLGDRLLPITINTPKPLVRVKGTRIIDTAIDAALAKGIEEAVALLNKRESIRQKTLEGFSEDLVGRTYAGVYEAILQGL